MHQEGTLIDKLYRWTIKATEVACSVLLGCMVVIVFANVVARYYLSASLAWSEELARFMLIWLVFLGAVLAYVHNEHLGLDLLVSKLPRRLAHVAAIVADLLVLLALFLLAKGGYMMTVDSWDWEAPATYLPFGYIYIVIPVVGVIMFLQTILKMAVTVRAIIKG
ncbi:TRAP transporter small permease [Anaeroselena agilis]|uniref:TRAP transporter small permease n=1 Tax=Anaeroselena agilis TaxID=3063788 RepID=A0ABU3P1J0_9FIRM|nr:TRAP transporter small permease [Selenomonadales bacterium 4137-cl]